MKKACKEAKLSPSIAKKWMRKRQESHEEVHVSHKNETIVTSHRMVLAKIKLAIDKACGNIFIKDIQAMLLKETKTLVPIATLQYWVKHGLRYSLKRSSIVSPDVRQVVFVSHQVEVSE